MVTVDQQKRWVHCYGRKPLISNHAHSSLFSCLSMCTFFLNLECMPVSVAVVVYFCSVYIRVGSSRLFLWFENSIYTQIHTNTHTHTHTKKKLYTSLLFFIREDFIDFVGFGLCVCVCVFFFFLLGFSHFHLQGGEYAGRNDWKYFHS